MHARVHGLRWPPSPSSRAAAGCRSRACRRTRPSAALPAEEDVARGLHQPLALHHPLTLIRESALPTKGASTESWASFTCRNRGSASSRPSSRTIHARVPTLPTPDDLARRVDEAEVLQEVPAVSRAGSDGRCEASPVDRLQERRGLVGGQELLDGHDEWRIAHDPRLGRPRRGSACRTPGYCPSSGPCRRRARPPCRPFVVSIDRSRWSPRAICRCAYQTSRLPIEANSRIAVAVLADRRP